MKPPRSLWFSLTGTALSLLALFRASGKGPRSLSLAWGNGLLAAALLLFSLAWILYLWSDGLFGLNSRHVKGGATAEPSKAELRAEGKSRSGASPRELRRLSRDLTLAALPLLVLSLAASYLLPILL